MYHAIFKRIEGTKKDRRKNDGHAIIHSQGPINGWCLPNIPDLIPFITYTAIKPTYNDSIFVHGYPICINVIPCD